MIFSASPTKILRADWGGGKKIGEGGDEKDIFFLRGKRPPPRTSYEPSIILTQSSTREGKDSDAIFSFLFGIYVTFPLFVLLAQILHSPILSRQLFLYFKKKKKRHHVNESELAGVCSNEQQGEQKLAM